MRRLVVFEMIILILLHVSPNADARSIAKAPKSAKGKEAMSDLLCRDTARDFATKPKPLEKDTKVRRFVSTKKELQHDLPANKHMTAPIGAGRLPGGKRAQKQYGLPKVPKYAGTIKLEKGTPVRKNKALGGEPGRGEFTSPKSIKKNNITNIIKLSP